MLIRCSECGHDVSDKAASCPNCGAPVEVPQKEKKITCYYEHFMVCPKCGFAVGGVSYNINDCEEGYCGVCGCTDLIDTGIEASEENQIKVAEYVKNNPDVDQIKYQTNLKDPFIGKKDPLRMVRYKSREEAKKRSEELQWELKHPPQIPRCPTCKSADIHRISGSERVGSVITLGLFSKKINKSFKCNNCGYTW